ncbi:hypothetical protein ACFLY9_02000 [Patescibacteria group bacterium]
MLRTFERKKKSKLPYIVILAVLVILFIRYIESNSQSSKVESQESQNTVIASDDSKKPNSEVEGEIVSATFSINSLFNYVQEELPEYDFKVSENSFQWFENGSSKQVDGKILSYESETGTDRIEQVILDYLYMYDFNGNSENSVISDGGKNILGLEKNGVVCKIVIDNDYFELSCGK